VFVKICGITSESDALLAVALGADALGFVFAPSPRQIAPLAVADIVKRLPPEVVTIGVFRNETSQRVIDVVHSAHLHGAQLHGHESNETSLEVANGVRFSIKAVIAGSQDARNGDMFGVDVLLVDGHNPGSGEAYDFELLEQIPPSMRWMLAGGLTPETVSDAIVRTRPWGVDVSSGVEKSPGVKDAVKLRHFIANARSAASLIGDEDTL
jgi:phosphoribosylanthranilate isomerase